MSHGVVAIIIQARMSSSRLPGKVLMPLAGAPSIVRMMERVRRVQRARYSLVATSVDPSDDVLAATCEQEGIPVARGSLHDVLQRMVDAVPADADVVVRLTGDCPLVDPALVDEHIRVFLDEQPAAQYVTNAVVRTMPKGLDVEVVSRDTLVQAGLAAKAPYDREHVLPWVRRNKPLRAVTQAQDLSALRWTLDSRLDYETIAGIYDGLYTALPAFGASDVYRALIARPGLIQTDERTPLSRAESSRWIAPIQAHLRDLESAPGRVSPPSERDKGSA